MSYTDDEMLMLSGIQHFRFCPRQWALIHIEQIWEDNRLTFEGQLLHSHVDDPFYRKKKGGILTLRSVNIASKSLGLYGVADLIEMYPSESVNSMTYPGYPGKWRPYPIEYKHGKPKPDFIDEVQLAAQAMCLEEMYGLEIYEGAIFYGLTQHRHEIRFSSELRLEVKKSAEEMHAMFETQKLPAAEKGRKCNSCSLKEECLPQLSKKQKPSDYIKMNLYEKTTEYPLCDSADIISV